MSQLIFYFRVFFLDWLSYHGYINQFAYHLPIAGLRKDGFMPFLRLLSETKTVLSRIWTWLTESIFYDDKHYAIFAKREREREREREKRLIIEYTYNTI